MKVKRILTVQDMSCVGQCSLTVALPILSVCGVETCPLPTAVLSTHTGGFKGFTVRDLSPDIPGITAHWQREGLLFDAFYTGYLASGEQVDQILTLFDTLAAPGAPRIVDPAMADNGLMYKGLPDGFAAEMLRLCRRADILLPNTTEACMLTGLPWQENMSEAQVDALLDRLQEICPTVILTGVGFREGFTGVMVAQDGERRHYEHRKMPHGRHGTGDIYSSAFTGALLRGLSAYDAAVIAADYTLACIERTQDDPDHWYGVHFESALPLLSRRLEDALHTP